MLEFSISAYWCFSTLFWEFQTDGQMVMTCINSYFALLLLSAAAAAAKSLQSCPTLCDLIDGSPSGSPIPGILQARTLEWVAISFSNAWKWKVKAKSLSRVRLLVTPWTAAYQAPPSMGFSRQEYWSGVPLLVCKIKMMVFLSRDPIASLRPWFRSCLCEIVPGHCILKSQLWPLILLPASRLNSPHGPQHCRTCCVWYFSLLLIVWTPPWKCEVPEKRDFFFPVLLIALSLGPITIAGM